MNNVLTDLPGDSFNDLLPLKVERLTLVFLANSFLIVTSCENGADIAADSSWWEWILAKEDVKERW